MGFVHITVHALMLHQSGPSRQPDTTVETAYGSSSTCAPYAMLAGGPANCASGRQYHRDPCLGPSVPQRTVPLAVNTTEIYAWGRQFLKELCLRPPVPQTTVSLAASSPRRCAAACCFGSFGNQGHYVNILCYWERQGASQCDAVPSSPGAASAYVLPSLEYIGKRIRSSR